MSIHSGRCSRSSNVGVSVFEKSVQNPNEDSKVRHSLAAPSILGNRSSIVSKRSSNINPLFPNFNMDPVQRQLYIFKQRLRKEQTRLTLKEGRKSEQGNNIYNSKRIYSVEKSKSKFNPTMNTSRSERKIRKSEIIPQIKITTTQEELLDNSNISEIKDDSMEIEEEWGDLGELPLIMQNAHQSKLNNLKLEIKNLILNLNSQKEHNEGKDEKYGREKESNIKEWEYKEKKKNKCKIERSIEDIMRIKPHFNSKLHRVMKKHIPKPPYNPHNNTYTNNKNKQEKTLNTPKDNIVELNYSQLLMNSSPREQESLLVSVLKCKPYTHALTPNLRHMMPPLRRKNEWGSKGEVVDRFGNCGFPFYGKTTKRLFSSNTDIHLGLEGSHSNITTPREEETTNQSTNIFIPKRASFVRQTQYSALSNHPTRLTYCGPLHHLPLPAHVCTRSPMSINDFMKLPSNNNNN